LALRLGPARHFPLSARPFGAYRAFAPLPYHSADDERRLLDIVTPSASISMNRVADGEQQTAHGQFVGPQMPGSQAAAGAVARRSAFIPEGRRSTWRPQALSGLPLTGLT